MVSKLALNDKALDVFRHEATSRSSKELQDSLHLAEPEPHLNRSKWLDAGCLRSLPSPCPSSRSEPPPPLVFLKHAEPDDHWKFGLYRYLEEETNIPIPPYRVVTMPIAGTELVIEERIKNRSSVVQLSEIWNLLDDRKKKRAVVQIREKIKLLRSITPSDVSKPPFITDRYISRLGCDPMNKDREYSNNNEFVDVLKSSVAAVDYDPDLSSFAAKCIEQLKTSKNELVFTHGNLTADNIYVNPETGNIVAIANWSEAGYYPLYWEYVKARLSYNSEPNFVREGTVEKIMDPWWIELALMKPAQEMIF
ncbi:hypothetical protein EsH8_X_000202 [Colletotrichum jinshuiense]